MPFDGSPEEMYPEHFPEAEEPVGVMDREPYRPLWSRSWYFRVDHETYGFFRSEEEAWKQYGLARDEAYTDED
jgi:hypothetical protein